MQVLFNFTVLVSIFVSCFRILFRCTLYQDMPVHEGDAYGFADVIEFFLYFFVYFMAVNPIVVGGVLLYKKQHSPLRIGLGIGAVLVSLFCATYYYADFIEYCR